MLHSARRRGKRGEGSKKALLMVAAQRVKVRAVRVWGGNEKGVARPEGDAAGRADRIGAGEGGLLTPIVSSPATMVTIAVWPLVAAG